MKAYDELKTRDDLMIMRALSEDIYVSFSSVTFFECVLAADAHGCSQEFIGDRYRKVGPISFYSDTRLTDSSRVSAA